MVARIQRSTSLDQIAGLSMVYQSCSSLGDAFVSLESLWSLSVTRLVE